MITPTARPYRFSAALLALVFLSAACAGDATTTTAAGESADVADTTTSTDESSDSDEVVDEGTAEATDSGDELADRTAVALAAQWSDNVEISVDGDNISFKSDGLPSHEYLDSYLADGRDGKYIAGGVESYDASFSFPIVPTVADSASSTGNGAIGVAISGAVFFDPYEGDGSDTVANDDQSEIDGIPFIDACGGHPLPNAISYHYHGIPFCITDAVDTDGEHSTLIGYLFDGFGIYGPQDTDGSEPADLDACMGHTGATPEFGYDTYHYHASSSANYISECLTGVAATSGR